MSIKKVNSDSEYGGWIVENWAINEAIKDLGWIEHEEKHYCPNCIEWNEDETELVPKS